MPRRVRILVALIGLSAALALAALADLRVRSTLQIQVKGPPAVFGVSYDTDRGCAGNAQAERRTAGGPDDGEACFEFPPVPVKGVRLSWNGDAGPIRLEGITLRKLFQTLHFDAPDVLANARILGDLEPLSSEGGGIVLVPRGPAPSLAFSPPGLDRFAVIGVKYAFPLCFAFAFFLYLATGVSYRRWWRFRELILNLTKVNLTLKYRGSALGFFWSLLNPILMLAIYSMAFRYIMRIQLESYPFFLILGLLPWNFLSMTLISSTTSVVNNAGLLKKASFPREVFPLSTAAFVFIQFMLGVLAIGPFCLIWKSDFAWFDTLFFAVVISLFVFTVGLALLLSSLTVIYRDMQHFTEVSILALFWLSPVVYNYELVPVSFRWLFLLNPITFYMNSFHDLIYWNRMPDALTWAGIAIWPLATLSLGAAVFRRLDPRFAEVL